MKFSTTDNPLYNLSRPLVVLVATLVGGILCSAIAQAETPSLETEVKQPRPPELKPFLISQVGSDVRGQELSLVLPQPKKPTNQNLAIAQLLPEQQLMAQIWTKIDHQQLSLAGSAKTLPQRFLIAQLQSPQQQLMAQLWSEIEVKELSLAIPDTQAQSAITEAVLIAQLLPQQQQLMAQLWSDIADRELSLATPTGDRQSSFSSKVEIAQLLPAEQELIAQIWSNIDTEKLSLVTSEPFPALGNKPEESKPTALEAIALPQLDSEQQLMAQAWAEADQKQLTLAPPIDEFDSIAALSSPFIERTPATRVPSKDEIAARIVLNKVKIITPAPGVVIDGKANNSSVTVQYPVNTTVKLEINGQAVDNALVTREQLNFETNTMTQTWQGASLNEGLNNVSVIASKSGFSKETNREVIVKSERQEAESEAESTPEQQDTQKTEAESAPEPPKSTVSENYSQELVKILTPKADAVLENISSTVIIQFPEEAKVILQVNGKPVNASQAGRTEINPVTKIVTQTWYGVIFNAGTNKLGVLATTDGKKYSETAIDVVVPGQPKDLKISTRESYIPADGKSIATVKGRFVDEAGATAVWDEIVTLNSSDGQFVGTDLEPDRPGFQVKTDKGEFSAPLQAGYDAEKVTIQAKARDLEAYTQIQFKNSLREQPLLTGFANLRIGARGTDYYDSFRDFLPLDEDNGATVDFDSAAFLTGSLGRWTYTGAYNSDRPLNEDSRGENRLFRSYSSSEEQYPIYGDSSTAEVVTPSIDRVYFRLERNSKVELADSDYFMWGDYGTEEFATESQEFSAVSRQLHGFKSNYNFGGLQLNALYANSLEGFQRDAISPDGTSGFYFLSRRLLVPGSEDIFLELSPLNDPGNIVAREALSLGIDYDIDYDRGTLFFKDPVLKTQVDSEGNILTRRIVATYQFESEASDSDLFAGRVRYHFDRDFNSPIWLGGTYLSEDRGNRDFELYGFDALISLGDWGSLSGEYARSENQTSFADASGSAYRFEGKVKFSQSIAGRAYYRDADAGFANNATLSFVPGQIRYGSELTAKLGTSTNVRVLYERQENEGVAPRPLDELEDFLDLETEPVPGNAVDNNLSTITAGVQQRIGDADLGLDLTFRDRQDNTATNNLSSTSTQLRSRFSIPVVNKLTFHALNDLTISNNTDAVFSDRLGVGLDYEFYSGLSLVLNHQWFTRGNLDGEALTTLGLQGEYEPWANATLTGKYGVTNGAAGINNTGSIGMQQKIPLTAGLDLDLNYERTFNDFDRNGTGRQFAQPFSVGQGASALSFESGSTYSVGLSYSDNPNFTADAKFQYSDGESGGNTVISGGVTGKLSRALTSLFSYSQASSANQTFDIGTTRDIRLGLAYRDPKSDKFNALLRYEYDENGGLIPETLFLGNGTGSTDHLFAGEVIYAPSWRWEFYSKLAFRNSRTFLADDFVSSSSISLGQFRTTYRLNYHMDLVGEARTIWQPSADYTESGFLLEAGYYLSPELRLSAGYVFGRADDEDFTGTRSAGGPYVGMTVKLNGLLDGFGQHSQPSLPEGVVKEAGGRGQRAEEVRGAEEAGEQRSRGQKKVGEKSKKDTGKQGDGKIRRKGDD